jgi:hypothetical protein
MSKLKELKSKREELEKVFKAEGKSALKEAFKEVFDLHPCVKSIHWDQYQAYWNDGDSTHFSVYEFFPEIAGYEDIDDDYELSEEIDKRGTKDEKLAKDAVNALYDECSDMDEIMKSVFGDHVSIKATRKGFSVSACDHE